MVASYAASPEAAWAPACLPRPGGLAPGKLGAALGLVPAEQSYAIEHESLYIVYSKINAPRDIRLTRDQSI